MRILAIHNFHRKGSSSGDDLVFNNETALLEKNGNTVIRYFVSNDEFDNAGIFGKLKKTLGMFWSFKHYRNVKKLCKKEKPDVVHIHTFFPLLSPSVLYAAKRSSCKVIATLHDTRLVCPCATSMCNGKLCNKCTDGKFFRMCKYGCFKGSKIQSFIVAMIFQYHKFRKTFHKQIDTYICLNDSQIDLLIKAGFDKNKIVKKYNFVKDLSQDLPAIDTHLPERYVVYYGRMGEEKGLPLLMKMWDEIDNIPLVLMGSGPLEESVKLWANDKTHVYYLGYTERKSCLAIVKNAEFVVLPSVCYEGCSMVGIETESLSKPLIAFNLGFFAEEIENEKNGLLVSYKDTNEFCEKVRMLWEHSDLCKRMGRCARISYEKKFSPQENYQELLKIICRV